MVGMRGPSTSWRVNTTSALGRLEAVLTRHFAQDERRGRRIGGRVGVTVASVGVNRCGRAYGNDGGGAGGGLGVDEFRRGLGYVGSCLRRNDGWGRGSDRVARE